MQNAECRMPIGQGLLETTIAIGIIVTALFAVMTLTASNVRASEAAALRFGAVQLAREGVEVVRALRDANWLAGRAWNTGIAGNGTDYSAVPVFDPSTGAWSLSYGADALVDAAARVVRSTSNGRTFLVQQPSGGDGAGVTPYRRIMTVEPMCESRDGTRTVVTSGSSCGAERIAIGIRARAEVSWVHRGSPAQLTIEEMLYDWR